MKDFFRNLLLNIAVYLLPEPDKIPFKPMEESTIKQTKLKSKPTYNTTKKQGIPYQISTDENGNPEWEIKERYNGRSKQLTTEEIEFLSQHHEKYDREIYLQVKRLYAEEKGRRAISKTLTMKHGDGKGYSESNVRRYLTKIKELTGEKQASPLVN